MTAEKNANWAQVPWSELHHDLVDKTDEGNLKDYYDNYYDDFHSNGDASSFQMRVLYIWSDKNDEYNRNCDDDDDGVCVVVGHGHGYLPNVFHSCRRSQLSNIGQVHRLCLRLRLHS